MKRSRFTEEQIIGILREQETGVPVGIKASMVVMVPVSLAAGFLLASAARFVQGDIAAAHAESLARVSGPAPT